VGFDRKKEFRSGFKGDRKLNEALKNQWRQDGGLHDGASLRTAVLQAQKPCMVGTTMHRVVLHAGAIFPNFV